MIEVTYACRECGTINHTCIGNTPLNTKLDLTKNDTRTDWDYVSVECEMCGAENKIRVICFANPLEIPLNTKGANDE